jgi:uncharacterized caspase-like protein
MLQRLLASILILLILPAIAVASRGIGVVAIKDKSGKQVGLYKESHALVIGVSDYTQGWQDLESVPAEINDLASVLEAQGFHVVKVLNPNARELKAAFEDFVAQYGFNPDNRLLFFFSGHGHTRQVGKITKGYLVPADAPIPEKDPKGFKNKALSMKQIITWAEGAIESKHALFLFESCFSGTILKSRGKPPVPRLIKESTNHPVRQFISAGSAGQVVPSQSVFAPYFIRALKGEGDLNRDGYVTGTELGLYLRDQIMGGDTHQTPQVGKSFNPNFNEGDFVFSLLGREQIEQSVDQIVRERKKLEKDRIRIEGERKRIEAAKHLEDERVKLKKEQERLKTDKEKLARLSPSSGGNLPKEAGKWVKITTRGTPLRVRQIPDVKSRVVAQIPNGSVVPFFQEKNNYYQIDYLKDKKGWVHKNYSMLVDDPAVAKLSGKCPYKMSFILGGVFMAGPVKSLKEMSINAFCMDQYEVTQADYERVMGTNPSKFKGSNRPVEQVTWHEAKAFCKKVGKRLPTEWEWEKAAKAGTTTVYYWGNDPSSTYAWYGENLKRGHHPVGQKTPNALGLYDMSGNVWEWTYIDEKYKGIKVLRGGFWDKYPFGISSAIRDRFDPTERSNHVGFRCAQ